MRVLHILVLVAGCEWGGGPGPGAAAAGPVPDAAGHDASHGRDAAIDAIVDGAPDAPPDGQMMTGEHLLLTEVALTPTGAEFVEIFNPTAQAVDLSHYYLSNHGNYFKLPAGAPVLPSGHFVVQFKAGASLAANGVITLATGSAAAFQTAYGAAPTYSITDATVTKTAGTGTPSLTDTGTVVVLFQWDGAAPLVKDVDIMIAGMPTAASALVDKSGVTQGGGTYAMDADTIAAQASRPGAGVSTKRILRETGHETQQGTGNGITGHDETSEHTDVTWDTTFTAPTPGQIPAAL